MANNGQSSIFNFFIQCYPERVSEPFNSYIFLPFCNHSYRRLLYFRQNTGLGHFHTCLIFPTWKLHPNFSLSVGTAICWNLGPLLWIFLLEKPRLALKKKNAFSVSHVVQHYARSRQHQRKVQFLHILKINVLALWSTSKILK